MRCAGRNHTLEKGAHISAPRPTPPPREIPQIRLTPFVLVIVKCGNHHDVASLPPDTVLSTNPLFKEVVMRVSVVLFPVLLSLLHLLSPSLHSAVVINEIMKNPAAVSDNQGEWFELHNTGGE